MKKKKPMILSVGNDEPERELEFEVSFHLSLTTKQHYTRMKKLLKQALGVVRNNDNPKDPSIVCRS